MTGDLSTTADKQRLAADRIENLLPQQPAFQKRYEQQAAAAAAATDQTEQLAAEIEAAHRAGQ